MHQGHFEWVSSVNVTSQDPKPPELRLWPRCAALRPPDDSRPGSSPATPAYVLRLSCTGSLVPSELLVIVVVAIWPLRRHGSRSAWGFEISMGRSGRQGWNGTGMTGRINPPCLWDWGREQATRMATGAFRLWVVMVQSCQQMVRLIMAQPGASSWDPLVDGPGRRGRP